MSKIANDPRIDPRIKALMGAFPEMSASDVDSREALLAQVNTPEAIAGREAMTAMLDALDSDDIAPRAGLDVSDLEFVSEPDGNTVKIQFIRPTGDAPVPVVYYIDGGDMQTMSCYDGMYRAWGRIIASRTVTSA